MADKYILKVTAGPSYARKSHEDVHVNTEKPICISTEDVDVKIWIRVKNYRGLPENSPSTSPYFSHSHHTTDLYSIQFSFTPKNRSFNGHDLVFGNDFDHPIRDRLPWGFDTAFGFVKSFVDPGLYGDVRADEPYLYGPLLSSINVLKVGKKGEDESGGEGHAKGKEKGGDTEESGTESPDVVEEGAADAEGDSMREKLGIPESSAARMKFFLDEAHLKAFEFEQGRTYHCDFFNPYLDFNEFALKLPIITLPIIKYWDGQPLRYTLKTRNDPKPLFVILFSLLPRDWNGEDREEALSSAADAHLGASDAGGAGLDKGRRGQADGDSDDETEGDEGQAEDGGDDLEAEPVVISREDVSGAAAKKKGGSVPGGFVDDGID